MVVDDKQSTGSAYNPSSNIVSDYSNIPYSHIPYTAINSIGRVWIFKYTLALAKETLGDIRSKYENIPIPDAIIKLDGDILRREGKEEKEILVKEIRETLEQTGLQAQMKKQAENAEMMQKIYQKTPFLIYIG
jgi:6-phosphogluconate dehydrogenase